MASHGNDGASMAFVWIEPPIEQADVVLAVSLDANGAVGRFDEGPFEIVVDVAAGAAVANVAAAGDDARNKPRVTGQVFSSWEPFDIADLQPDQRGEDRPESGDGAQQPHLWTSFELFSDAALDGFDLL